MEKAEEKGSDKTMMKKVGVVMISSGAFMIHDFGDYYIDYEGCRSDINMMMMMMMMTMMKRS